MMKKSLKIICLFLLISLVSGLIGSGSLIDLTGKNKSIKITVAYNPTDSCDAAARILAKNMEKISGADIQVVNLDGLEGQVGYKAILDGNPDGYTIGVVNLSTLLCFITSEHNDLSIKNIIPLISFTQDREVLAVKNDNRFNGLNDFISYAETHPKELNIANSSYGDISHILAADLSYTARVEFTYVSFNGTGNMTEAVKRGFADGCVADLSDVEEGVKSGELKILASFSRSRLEEYPKIPTLYENNYPIVFSPIKTVVIPNKTPGDIVEKLHYLIKETVESEDFIQDCKNFNIESKYMGPDETYIFMDKQYRFIKSLRNNIDLE